MVLYESLSEWGCWNYSTIGYRVAKPVAKPGGIGDPIAWQAAAGSSKAASGMPIQPVYSMIYRGLTSHLVDNNQSSMHSIPLRTHIYNRL